MPGEIKSAKEIALAKIEAEAGRITNEDRLRWQYVPEGEKLAARVVNDGIDIKDELDKADEKAVSCIKQGAMNVLLANVILPVGDLERTKNERALKAIIELKENKDAAKEVMANVENLFEHYKNQGESQKQQALEQLKQEYGSKIKQALEQQLGTSASGMMPDVENLPQFQEEKRRLFSRFDNQYLDLLAEYKKKLKDLG